MSGVRGVLIDAYGTLLDISGCSPAASRRVVEAEGLAVPPERFSAVWDRHTFMVMCRIARRHYAAVRFPRVGEVLAAGLLSAFRSLGVEGDAERGVRIWFDEVEKKGAYPEAAGVLAALAGRYRIAMVSNADDGPLRAALARCRLDRFFDAVVSSESARAYKPHPRIFRTALKALSLSPREVVHVGDSVPVDVKGALNAGILPIWVRRESGWRRMGPPTVTVTDLRPLTVRFLEGLRPRQPSAPRRRTVRPPAARREGARREARRRAPAWSRAPRST